MSSEETAYARKVRDFLKVVSPQKAEIIEHLDADARVWEVVDSLSLLDLLTALEDAYGFAIEALDVVPENFRSISTIAQYVDRRVKNPE